jgi:choline kinase
LTDALPKCLLPVGGRTIVSRAVSNLSALGITSITVVDGFEGDRLRAELTAEFPPDWFEFVRNDDYDTTNNAWSLWLARRPSPEPFLLLDADLVFDAEILALLLRNAHPNRLAVRGRGAIGAEDVKVTVGPDMRIVDIGKDLALENCAGESIGVALFSAQLAHRLFSVLERRLLGDGLVDEWYEAAFVELIAGGEAIHAVDIGDLRAIEVDTPEDLEAARVLFDAGR